MYPVYDNKYFEQYCQLHLGSGQCKIVHKIEGFKGFYSPMTYKKHMLCFRDGEVIGMIPSQYQYHAFKEGHKVYPLCVHCGCFTDRCSHGGWLRNYYTPKPPVKVKTPIQEKIEVAEFEYMISQLQIETLQQEIDRLKSFA